MNLSKVRCLIKQLSVVIVILICHVNYCFASEAETNKFDIFSLTDLKDLQTTLGKEKDDNFFNKYRSNYVGYSFYNSDKDDQGILKFQLSIKIEPVKESDWFFGYTQKSFWNINKFSSPFSENNYSPELFYQYKLNTDSTSEANSYLKSLKSVQIGLWRHESTGEAGSGSHGWNTTYIEPTFIFSKHFSVIPKVWFPVVFIGKNNSAPDNPDIYNYYGYGELTAKYAFTMQNQISTTFRKGTLSKAYGSETKIDFGFGKLWDKFNPTFFIQFWNGYGESLKKYNHSSTDLVIGLSAVM